jgi:hypothetical protein
MYSHVDQNNSYSCPFSHCQPYGYDVYSVYRGHIDRNWKYYFGYMSKLKVYQIKKKCNALFDPLFSF